MAGPEFPTRLQPIALPCAEGRRDYNRRYACYRSEDGAEADCRALGGEALKPLRAARYRRPAASSSDRVDRIFEPFFATKAIGGGPDTCAMILVSLTAARPVEGFGQAS
jgi:hypothetical protein